MLLATLLLSTFNFGGGSPQALAAALAKEARTTAVVYTSSSADIQPQNIQYEASRDLVDGISSALGYRSYDNADLVFFSQTYPRNLVLSNSFFTAAIPPVAGTLTVRDGRVTTSADGATILLSQLEAMKFTKPVTVHWFVKKLAVSVACTNEREGVFLKLVAGACGADFYESPAGYKLDFSPSQYRMRAGATFSEVGANDEFPMRRETLAFTLAAFSLMTDEELATAFKSTTASVSVAIKRADSVYQLSIDRLNRLHQREIEGSPDARNTQAYDWVKAKVDFESPGLMVYYPMQIPQTKLHVKREPNAWFVF